MFSGEIILTKGNPDSRASLHARAVFPLPSGPKNKQIIIHINVTVVHITIIKNLASGASHFSKDVRCISGNPISLCICLFLLNFRLNNGR